MAATGNLTLENITFDSVDPDRLAQWWSTAVGGTVNALIPNEFVVVQLAGGPRLAFQHVDDPTPGKTRIHVDFSVADVEAEVARLVDLGATEVGRHSFGDFGWVVLQDPDGNAFCIAPAMN